MAEKYLLRVSAGPSYDPSTHNLVHVNKSEPFEISGPWGSAHLHVRIRNYRGLPRGSPRSCRYFDHPLHLNDQYSISFSFLPTTSIPGHELVFGNDFDRPIRDRLPPGFGKAFKLVRWVIDPGLEGDPYADEPYLYGPALSSINVLRVGGKTESLSDHQCTKSEDGVVEEGGDGDGLKIRDAKHIPRDAAARKKWFLDEAKRKEWEFEAGRLHCGDFFNPYLDFNEFSLKLPGFSLPILRFLDAKELKSHTLRYVLKNQATKEVYFVIVFAVLLVDEVNGEERAAETKKEKEDADADADADGVMKNSTIKGVAEGGLLAAAAAGEAKAGGGGAGGAAFEPSADDVD
ncbi:MAG: hypothetical protein M1823_002762 [Watsoniomyces obsoletus]|nr:MAG: hypothetical protein M1823_002762 [Watsoniomyces obsoletus]